MQSVEDSREFLHDEHDTYEPSPEVFTQDSEENNTDLEGPGYDIADALKFPRKLCRLQKNDERQGKGQERSE